MITRKKIFCEFDYINCSHLNQIYEGFDKLANMGIVQLKVNYVNNQQELPILKVRVNHKIDVVYDTLDGFNWIDESIEKNLIYYKENTFADFYFKRSFNKILLQFLPKNCKVYPLGFNYFVSKEWFYINQYTSNSLKSKMKLIVKRNLKNLDLYKTNPKLITSKNVENLPIQNSESKILFLTRLWNTDETNQTYNKELRKTINAQRIEYINACKLEFGKRFIGGLSRDSFSEKFANKLIVSNEITNKYNYLNAVKNHDICIATTGLHKSIGWKMGEYVAASRAIISEKLEYELPGDFHKDKNYLEFNSKEELLTKIDSLLSNKNLIQKLMNNNFNYYIEFLEPSNLIYNTLKLIMEEAS